MDKWEAAGSVLPAMVVVVGRRVEEGPELSAHRQEGDRGCSKKEQHCQRSFPSGALNAKDGKNLHFLPRVLGATWGMGLGGAWTVYRQLERDGVFQTNRELREVLSTHLGLIHLYNL